MHSTDTTDSIPENAIAIIGMAGRFPGASNVDEFWENILKGVESIHHFSDKELQATGIPQATLDQPNYVKANAVLSDYDKFDASFFGFNPGDAAILDPQQRLLFESGWTALEHAGYAPNAITDPVGVFVGVGANTYLLQNLLPNSRITQAKGAFQLNIASDKDFAATHLAYKLNLTGPCITVQTACSTSLVAIHTACQNLLSFQCDLALAGGSSLSVPQEAGYLFSEGGIASPDGHCKPFTAEANGTVRGSGVGVVVLKRLESAIEDNDTIHAVILGSAANNDGNAKVGYTAPSVEGQSEVIAMAHSFAEVEAESIAFIETHGTGTSLGDPIEFEALSRVFASEGSTSPACALGAVKGNIGHLDCAAGVAGFIKAALSLKHKTIPPNLHASTTHPKIDFASSPFYLPAQATDWESSGQPRRTGISSFGIGGTNAHVVLQEAPATIKDRANNNSPQLIVLSARTEDALQKQKHQLKDYLINNRDIPLSDVAYTLQAGRAALEHRFHCVVETIQACIEALQNEAPTPEQNNADPDSLEQLGARWQSGETIDWSTIHPEASAKRIPLPTYPFAKTRHWIDPIQKLDQPVKTEPIHKHGPYEENFIYTPQWEEVSLPSTQSAPDPGHCWLFIHDTAEHDAIAQVFTELGYETQKVYPESQYFESEQSVNTLFQNKTASDSDVIIHLWNQVKNAPDNRTGPEAFNHLLFLAKALSQHRNKTQLKLLVACNTLYSINNETITHPHQALLTGPCLTIPQEMPNISTQLVDLPSIDVEQLQKEIASGFDSHRPIIAYREGKRFARTYSKPTHTPENTHTFKTGGTYWITGGLGGMGLALAEKLTEAFKANVMLSSRTLPSPEQQQSIERIQAQFQGEVFHVQADVTSEQEMQIAKAQAEQKWGKIDGIIHAAGVPGGSVLALKTTGEAAQVMAPKTLGVAVIETLFENEPDTAIILCSSIAALQGGFGQADYCSANAYLDAWAQAQRSQGRTNITAINWDGWIESGMAVRSAKNLQAQSAHRTKQKLFDFRITAADDNGINIATSTCSQSSHWMLKEHAIAGTSVMPGTGFIELARSAFSKGKINTPSPITFTEIYFLAPLALGTTESRPLKIQLETHNETTRFSIATETEHAKGKITTTPSHKDIVPLSELKASFPFSVAPFDRMRKDSHERGPRWQSRQWIKAKDQNWLSFISLDDAYVEDLSEHPLHPALLDVAVGFPNRTDNFYVPFAYSKLTFYRPLSQKLYSWVRQQKAFAPDMKSFDVTLYDESGNVLVDIEDYQVRKVSTQATLDVSQTVPSIEEKDNTKTQRLTFTKPGVLQSLQWEVLPRPALDPDSVEIEVAQVSLNFKDVLKALGTLHQSHETPPLGDECCGRVLQVGAHVSGIEPGDTVIALTSPAFQRNVVVHQDYVLPKPASVPLDVAASFSIAAMTAHHALINLGRLAPGESILIQAATGGVGLAAVHLAQHLGATVFATAGSPSKRQYLKSMGVQHVYDSRSLDFAQQIQNDTQGAGVDVVLNSLAGEYIEKGLSVLKRYGRFLELGKRDILENNPLSLAPFDRSLSFIAANLDRDHPKFQTIWKETLQSLTSGALPALPTRVFDKQSISDAFQYMARAQHIGKVVVALDDASTTHSTTQGLTNAQGKAALLLAIQTQTPQVIVSTTNLSQRIEQQQDAYKVLKTAVRTSTTHSHDIPASPAEVQKTIQSIWRDVLGVETIAIEDNFFEIGGDSLAAVQVLSHLNDTFQQQVPISEFFSAPTIQGLAQIFAPKPAQTTSENDELTQSLQRGRQRKARRQRRSQ